MDVIEKFQPLFITVLSCGSAIALALIFKQPLSGIIERAKSITISRKKKDNALELDIEVYKKHEEVAGQVQPAQLMLPKQETIGPVLVQEERKQIELSDIYEKLLANDVDEADRLFEQLQNNTSDKKTRLQNRSFMMFGKIRFGHEKNMEKYHSLLEEAAEFPDIQGGIAGSIAYLYSYFGKHSDAVAFYKRAVDLEPNAEKRADYISGASRSVQATEGIEQALLLLTEALSSCRSPSAEFALYKSIHSLLKDGYPDIAIAAYEKAIAAVPNDRDALFNVAYNSSSNLTQLHYYDRALALDPHNGLVLNNLGVTLSKLELPLSSVSSYRRAMDEGNTLSTANIAFELIKHGFAEEARELLKWAQGQTDPHPNISSALAQLEKDLEKEKAKRTEVGKLAARRAEFSLRLIQKIVSREAIGEIAGTWRTDSGNHFMIEKTSSDVADGKDKGKSLFSQPFKLNVKLGTTEYQGQMEFYLNCGICYIWTTGTSVLSAKFKKCLLLLNPSSRTLEVMIEEDNGTLDLTTYMQPAPK